MAYDSLYVAAFAVRRVSVSVPRRDGSVDSLTCDVFAFGLQVMLPSRTRRAVSGPWGSLGDLVEFLP